MSLIAECDRCGLKDFLRWVCGHVMNAEDTWLQTFDKNYRCYCPTCKPLVEAEDLEQRERAELARLKAKWEPPAGIYTSGGPGDST